MRKDQVEGQVAIYHQVGRSHVGFGNGSSVQPRNVIRATGGYFPFHTPGISGALPFRRYCVGGDHVVNQ